MLEFSANYIPFDNTVFLTIRKFKKIISQLYLLKNLGEGMQQSIFSLGSYNLEFNKQMSLSPPPLKYIYVIYRLGGPYVKYFVEVSKTARDRRSRDVFETETKYFSVRTDLNGK